MQLLHGAFPAQRPHGLSITPFEMLSELVIQLINVSKPLPIIEISLVVAVAPLHLPVVPRRSRRNQPVLYPRFT